MTNQRGIEAPNSPFNRARRDVQHCEKTVERLTEQIARAEAAKAELVTAKAALAAARQAWADQQRIVERENVGALKDEMCALTADLDSGNWTPAKEKRLFEILSAARMCGASGQSYEAFRVTMERLKRPGTADKKSGIGWAVFNGWIHVPENRSAAP